MVLFGYVLFATSALAKFYFKEDFSNGSKNQKFSQTKSYLVTERWVLSESKSNYGTWDVGLGKITMK